MQALEMMDTIETETSAKVVLAADPCYGACDLVHDKMKLMGVELVAHMGHSQMNIESGMPTQFIDVTYDGDPELTPVIPFLDAHKAIAQTRMANQGQIEGIVGRRSTRAVPRCRGAHGSAHRYQTRPRGIHSTPAFAS